MLDYCASVLEATYEACSDGVDNDRNGYIDCADHGCSQHTDAWVKRACRESLGVDCNESFPRGSAEENAANDACVALNLPKTAADACKDRVDNDGDGFTDCDDWDCSWNPVTMKNCCDWNAELERCERPRVCE